jgi:hypothetical protein
MKLKMRFISGQGRCKMLEEDEMPAGNEFLGARPRVLVTNAAEPEDGRTFVWTKMGWFEREEGNLGDVAFARIADSEDELRGLLYSGHTKLDLFEAGGEFRKTVTAEFIDQEPINPDSADNYSEDEFEE